MSAAAAAAVRPGQGMQGANRDPDAARLIAGDLPRFWDALDRAADGGEAERAAAFRERYLRPGTAGLRSWMRLRLSDRRAVLPALRRAGWSEERAALARALPPGAPERRALEAAASAAVESDAAAMLARVTFQRPRFYAAVRDGALALDGARAIADPIRQCFHRLEALYDDAVFPDVYLLVGALNARGTVGPAGIFIAAEMYGRAPGTPTDELTGWERDTLRPAGALPGTVAHELVHCQQPRSGRKLTLLGLSLREGAADFVGALIAGGPFDGGARHAYGDAHEGELWAEFSAAMHAPSLGDWLYHAEPAGGRPPDLGYYMGYRICQAYYRRAPNARAAVRGILTMTDPEAFLRESGYAPHERGAEPLSLTS